ncbi:MAG: transcriptional regulator [Bacteroidetes bacterium]|nr:MAG: transcriptional regulator [Bacteroidota bacterium]
MKLISCIREEKDQFKINSFENLLTEFNADFRKLSKVIGLIGNDVRLKLMWLINEDKFCVCDLADILQMSVPAISQHLRKLRDVDIVDSYREKQTIYYLKTKENKEIVDHLLDLVSKKISI